MQFGGSRLHHLGENSENGMKCRLDRGFATQGWETYSLALAWFI